MVLQPCALWGHPASQLGGGPIDTGSPEDGRTGHCCSCRDIWERRIPAGESLNVSLCDSSWWGVKCTGRVANCKDPCWETTACNV